MKGFLFLSAFFVLALAFPLASAYDPDPLQDFCVATGDIENVTVNGRFCKDPNLVSSEDFLFRGLGVPRDTNNQLGSNVTVVDVNSFPGLNTLGISLARIDYAPGGINPPHTHPRATEILTCWEGILYVGFVSSNPNNTLFSAILRRGDVFVFPKAMIHFQKNIGKTNAVALSSLSSQHPGVITVANALFGSVPPINPVVLARAFQLDEEIVRNLQGKFWEDNNYA